MNVEDEIKCPWCGVINDIYSIGNMLYSSGAKKCNKCRKWFEWQENKVVTFKTFKIIQSK